MVLAKRLVSKPGCTALNRADAGVLLFIEWISSRPEPYRIQVNDTAVNCQELYCCLSIKFARITAQELRLEKRENNNGNAMIIR